MVTYCSKISGHLPHTGTIIRLNLPTKYVIQMHARYYIISDPEKEYLNPDNRSSKTRREWSSLIFRLQPPLCNSIARRRRDANDDEVKGVEGLDGTPATIEVYSGLYVNEVSDVSSKSDFSDDVFRERVIWF